MSNFFDGFEFTQKSDWLAKIESDLKGKDPSILNLVDPIEELNLSGYHHQEDLSGQHETPGNFPFTRGLNQSNNDWNNGVRIIVTDEKAANSEALRVLMEGVNLLFFIIKKDHIDVKTLLNEIGVEYIQIHFEIATVEHLRSIREVTGTTDNVRFNIDPMKRSFELLEEVGSLSADTGQRFALVDGFSIQQCGATSWQEIAFIAQAGHETLLTLTNKGYSVDQALASIHFYIGVGANYFIAISKIRALKKVWSQIVKAYQPEHNCSYNCSITAIIGHTNKSLKDPHTNLLRQTTEAMSAAIGGVENVIVLPYDDFTTDTSSSLAKRMAKNIPLILKEESYLDKTIDPIGGSYSIETITQTIADQSWKLFQSLEKQGGLKNNSTLTSFKESVNQKRNARIERFSTGQDILIGVNKFDPLKKVETLPERITQSYLGINFLNIEFELENIS